MARRIQVVAKWEDLVLPAEDTDRIREFIGRSKHATRVYADWGFGQRLGYGKGMIALFSGPPGTGKTMLAGIISARAGPGHLSGRSGAGGQQVGWRDGKAAVARL